MQQIEVSKEWNSRETEKNEREEKKGGGRKEKRKNKQKSKLMKSEEMSEDGIHLPPPTQPLTSRDIPTPLPPEKG